MLSELPKRAPIPMIPLKANRADLVRLMLQEIAILLTASDEVFRIRLEKIQDAISDYRKGSK